MSTATGDLTIVTPSFEKHFEQYKAMLQSIVQHCSDLDHLRVVVVVERVNLPLFDSFLSSLALPHYEVMLTEDVLAAFSVKETPGAFLKRVGKFTFQTVKKLGALARVQTAWSLVLDSEGLFLNDFSVRAVLDDYARRKYVFYTQTAPRGPFWAHSTGYQVNRLTAEALSLPAPQRWYMESFHWFYETAKVQALLERLNGHFYNYVAGRSKEHKDYFENVLYYSFLEKYHTPEYDFVDFQEALLREVPDSVAHRFQLQQLPFSLFGNDYLLAIVQPCEVKLLAPLFEKYRLPFIRLEPPFFHHDYLQELKKLPCLLATVSSHHNIWLRKKLAVCISGDFRHDIHRTPEQQVRTIKSFLSGVDCDIFIYGAVNSSEPLILHELQPRAHRFEARPFLGELERAISYHEPNLKPGRDEGTLSMFHGLQKSFELLQPFRDEYDYVVRLRPDLFYDRSLKEVMVGISDEGDLLPDCVYVPKSFQSQGVNDQFAIGRLEKMAVYFNTLDHIRQNIASLYFNPEFMLLHNLLTHGVGIALVDLPYALMRFAEFRIATVQAIMQEQERVWWSSTSNLPPYRDLTAYFTDKLRATDAAGRGILPQKLYLPWPPGVLELRVVDNKPSRDAALYWHEGSGWYVAPCHTEGGKPVFDGADPSQTYCFIEGGQVVMSEWRFSGNVLGNERLSFPAAALDAASVPTEADMLAAWRIRDRGEHVHPGQPRRDAAGGAWTFPAAALSTRDGRLSAGALVTDTDGLLFYGPYAAVEPGRYTAAVHLCKVAGAGRLTLEVSVDGGERVLRRDEVAVGRRASPILLDFDVGGHHAVEIEVVGHVKGFDHIGVSRIVLSERSTDLAPPRPKRSLLRLFRRAPGPARPLA